jgi:hypothetical protein
MTQGLPFISFRIHFLLIILSDSVQFELRTESFKESPILIRINKYSNNLNLRLRFAYD